MNPRDRGPYPGTQSVARALSLLEAFTRERPEWGVRELARRVGLNKTTVFRLLGALEREGLVARNPSTDGYRLGPEAIALGARALATLDLRTEAREELEALARTTGETATLEVLAGSEVLILDEVAGPRVVGASPSVGTRWPVHATSTGKILLAWAEERRADLFERAELAEPARCTPSTISSRAELEAELEEVRRRGFAIAVDELEVGYAAAAAPVRDHQGDVVAAVSVGGPSARLRPERGEASVVAVRAAADRLSRRLGAPAEGVGPPGLEAAAVGPAGGANEEEGAGLA